MLKDDNADTTSEEKTDVTYNVTDKDTDNVTDKDKGGQKCTLTTETTTETSENNAKSSETGSETSSETGSETGSETKDQIINIIKQNPRISAAEIAKQLCISSRGVEKQIRKLRESGIIRRKGGRFGGNWEILQQ